MRPGRNRQVFNCQPETLGDFKPTSKLSFNKKDGNLLTSAGISAGIDMALRLVARYYGEAVARATARHMEYPFPDDNRRRV